MGDAATVKKYLDFLHNKRKKSIGIFGLMFYGLKWILGTVLGGIASLCKHNMMQYCHDR